MTKRNRIISIITALAVLFVIMYSSLYIATEINHDCAGDNCSICCQINICRNTLKTLSLACFAATTAALLTYTLCINILLRTNVSFKLTLVSLKVKLTD